MSDDRPCNTDIFLVHLLEYEDDHFDRAYKMGLDAASVHCEKLDLGWKDEAGLHVYPSAAYCAVAIRALAALEATDE